MSEVSHPRSGAGSRIVWTLLLLAACAGGYYWYTTRGGGAPKKVAAAPPAVPVTVMTTKNGRFEVRLEGLGVVQAVNTVVVRPRVDGQIEQVFFKEGQTVNQGDLLLRIDARPFQAVLDGAMAKLAQDQVVLKNSNLDLQRYSVLAKQQIASTQKLEAQQATVASGEAQIKADQATVDNAKVQLSYTEIRAPLTGRIGFRQVDAGNVVRAGDAQGLLSIVQTDPVNVLYTLPEGDLATVQDAFRRGPLQVVASVVGQRVTPTVTGTVAVVNNQVDQASGTVQIKALFDNKNMKLWPGQSVTTKTRVQSLDNVIVIPASIVQHGPDGLFVWRIGDDNVALPDKIKISDQDAESAVISSGLSVGDKLVTAGQLRLRKGTKVEPRDGPPDQQARLETGAAP